MSQKIWGNEYRVTTVCIDSYENKEWSGRFYNPYIEGESFESLTWFLIKMEQLLDQMKFPQACNTVRSFLPSPEPERKRSLAEGPPKGELATFEVRVIFRQNASWQGTVTWVNEGMEQSFRSVLELIFLMDGALSGAKKG